MPDARPAPAALAVDTHAHVFMRGLAMQSARRYTPDYDAPLAGYLGLLDAHGLSHGVLVQPSFLGADNRHLLEALALAGGRLRGVAVVAPGAQPDELTAMHRAGVRGIRLNLFGLPTPGLDQPAWQALLHQVNQLGWHVEVHTPAQRLRDALAPLLAAGCRVVVDHFGRPDPALGVRDPGFRYLLEQAASGLVWVKLSAPYRIWPAAEGASQGRQAALQLLDAFSAARLLWGSDWPHTENRHHADYPQACQWLHDWVADGATRRIILAGTPSALFGIQGDKP
ncbi:amidohydrolase family protein [Bordetella petrii]|uniref:amidohydrolase family protein n=1 Tax=Bordetella petrii TaxID=94624 RepID=UPI003D6C72FA